MVSRNRCDEDLLVRFEVLTLADMKVNVFWDVTSCSLVEKY
jgi:hypothetical protein